MATDAAAGRLQGQSGAVMVVVALLIPVVMGMTALVVDLGMVWETRRQLQNCADAAALAAAADLGNDSVAYSTALSYVYAPKSFGCLDAGDPSPAVTFLDQNGDGVHDAVQVVTTRSVHFGLARLLGRTASTVAARAVAGKVTPTEFLGMQPFGLQMDPGQPCGLADTSRYTINGQPLRFGQTYTIKYGSAGNSGSPGNYQALALGGNGANVYRDNVTYGYQGWIGPCDTVTTEPGNMVGPTLQAMQDRLEHDPDYVDPWSEIILTNPPLGCARWTGCKRVILIALVPPLGNGRSDATVLTLAWFLVQDIGTSGNHRSEITGRFIDGRNQPAPPDRWRGGVPWSPQNASSFAVRLLE